MSPWLSDLVLSSQSDERLVSLARAGYDRAFVAIFVRYKRRLLAFAIQLGSGSRAEDVVQQALLSAFAALREQREVSHLSGWLHQIVRNTSIQMVGRVPAESELDADAQSGVSIEEQVQSRLEAHAVLSNLADLPERQRSALVQTALAGHSRSEVALSMGVSEGAVRQLVHRARATLRSAAAALLPLPLVAWAARGGVRAGRGAPASAEAASHSLDQLAGPVTSQLGPIAAGAASTGGGLMLKTGAFIAATGILATGLVVSHGGHHHSSRVPPGSAATRLVAQASGTGRRAERSAPGGSADLSRSPQATVRTTRGQRSAHLSGAIAHRTADGRQVTTSDMVSSRRGATRSGPHTGSGSGGDGSSGDGGGRSQRSSTGSGSGHDGSGSGSGQAGGDGGSSSGQSSGQVTSGSGSQDGSSGSASGSVSESGDSSLTGSGDGSGDTSGTSSGDGISGSSTSSTTTSGSTSGSGSSSTGSGD